MKVPSGKRVYVGSRLFPPGSELPDAVAEKVGLIKKAIAPKPEIIKPIRKKETFEPQGTNRRGPGDDA
jgi:hypothetical protein